MTVYMVLLRGINVGGKHIVKMAELKKALEAMGYRRVQTYIQSGNIVLESDEEAGLLEENIEAEIKRAFGIAAAVMVRNSDEFARIMDNCPYSPEQLTEGQSIHVALLKREPSPEAVRRLAEVPLGIDEYRISGKEIYQLYRQSMLDSKLAVQLPKLNVPATDRNWKTIVKLAEMIRKMEG